VRSTGSVRVLYLAHDLSDPAVARRVLMLRRGGAEIKLLGFRRSEMPVHELEGVAAVDLGRTLDGRLGSRCIQVARQSWKAAKWGDLLRWSDVVLARNLEMVTIADAARIWASSHVRLAYECLDVHGALLGNRLRSKLLLSWERRALRRADMLIVSSRAFLSNYFEHQGVRLPEVIVAENKLILPAAEAEQARRSSGIRNGPPWRIGWFGYLRCPDSFTILMDVARRYPDHVTVVLRGRPTEPVQTLIDRYLPIENMYFGGPYAKTDLAEMHNGCDLTWGIDYSQIGQNSDWLLPNRLYEGGFYSTPVIALAGTETAAWLTARNAGVLLLNPAIDLGPFITDLSPARYHFLQKSTYDIPLGDLVWTTEDCRRLAARLVGEDGRQFPTARDRLRQTGRKRESRARATT
jgi:succinoglycan biosynthesis protein ExoL